MAYIVEFVCQRLLSPANFPPAFAVVFASVQIQRQCERDSHAIVHIEGVELGVDIKRE